MGQKSIYTSYTIPQNEYNFNYIIKKFPIQLQQYEIYFTLILQNYSLRGEVMDEKALVAKARRGDRESFGKLYALYKDKLYRYALFRVGEELAADAVSQCALEAWRSIPSLRDEGAFQGWIFKLLYRTCASQLKEQIRQRETSDIDEVQLPYSQRLDAVELSEALGSLSEQEREIVLLSAVSGFSSKEIGKLLGLRSSTVRSKLSRSLKKLRDFLE